MISNITDINLSSLSVSFIYQYPKYNSKWQWITRKNSTINRDLHQFVVDDNSHSYFNYIITNKFSSHFEHDKENLVRNGCYWLSENDKRFPILGSIASYKMSFIKNETILCTGYIIISTYGRTFVEDTTNQVEIDNFNNLLSNTIIPSYKHLIETELGFMYERHNILSSKASQRKKASPQKVTLKKLMCKSSKESNRLKTRRLYPHTFFCYTDSIQKYSEGGFLILWKYQNRNCGNPDLQTGRTVA